MNRQSTRVQTVTPSRSTQSYPQIQAQTQTVNTILNNDKIGLVTLGYITPEQGQYLESLTYSNGRSKLDVSDIKTLYEIIGILYSAREKDEESLLRVIDHITKAKDKESIIIDSPLMEASRLKSETEMGAVRYKPDIKYSSEYCPNCKRQTKTMFYLLQTRSADEPMSIFFTCTECDHKWRR